MFFIKECRVCPLVTVCSRVLDGPDRCAVVEGIRDEYKFYAEEYLDESGLTLSHHTYGLLFFFVLSPEDKPGKIRVIVIQDVCTGHGRGIDRCLAEMDLIHHGCVIVERIYAKVKFDRKYIS
jgi:hypothetical protein